MDREGDFFEPFAVRPQIENIDLLVRAVRSRRIGEEPPGFFDKVRGEPARQRLGIRVERSSARGRAARAARVALRWCTVDLPVLQEKPVALVHVGEEKKPGDGRKARFLLTTLPVASCEEALQVLQWYRLRRRAGSRS